MALICDPDDSERAAQGISDLIDDRIHFAPNESFLIGLHRRNLTGALADVIKQARSCESVLPNEASSVMLFPADKMDRSA